MSSSDSSRRYFLTIRNARYMSVTIMIHLLKNVQLCDVFLYSNSELSGFLEWNSYNYCSFSNLHPPCFGCKDLHYGCVSSRWGINIKNDLEVKEGPELKIDKSSVDKDSSVPSDHGSLRDSELPKLRKLRSNWSKMFPWVFWHPKWKVTQRCTR